MKAVKYRNKRKTPIRILCVLLLLFLVLSALVSCDNGTRGALSEALLEIEALKNGNAEISREIEALKTEKATAEDEIEALKNAGEELKNELDALNAERDGLKADCSEAEGEIESLEKELDALRSERDEQKAELDALREELKKLESGQSEKIRIYIDQGHNPTAYHNSGASGNGLYEEDLTYLIGQLLAEMLRADGRFEVALSRPSEYTVLGNDNNSSLDARVNGAREWEADYFISLHTNAAEAESASGIEVLVAEEGTVSHAFGTALLDALIDATGLVDRGMKARPELRVLKDAEMPAALIEMGFITNAGDAALLLNHPVLFAEGIYAGILRYFGLSVIGA